MTAKPAAKASQARAWSGPNPGVRGEPPPPIGIAGLHIIPGDVNMSSEEFSKISGVPKETVETKFGFTKLVRWGDLGPYEALFRASSTALGGLDPRELDAIVMFEHPNHVEHEIYGAANTLRDQLGADNADVLDISTACASSTMSLQLARDLMVAEDLDHVLLGGVVMVLDALDLAKQDMMWMANISDGAGAVLVSRDPKLDNVILETSIHSEPSFADDVVFTPADREKYGVVDWKQRYRRLAPRRMDTPDKNDMKRRLDPISVPNYLKVVNASLERSGFRPDQMDLIGTNTIKPSVWNEVLAAFKLDPKTQIYLDELGHMGYLDQFWYVVRVRRERRLPQGGILVLATPGVGFHWTATTMVFKGPRMGGWYA